MKIKYLSLALLNIICFSAVAAESNSMNNKNGFFDNTFFKNTKFEFSTRNHWKYIKENASQPKEVHSAWGQAFTFNYKSGYLLDILGFDFTYDNVIKLGASDYFASRNLLYNTGKKPNKHNAHGFNKFTQRYAKVKLGNSTDLNFNGKVGWHSLKDMGVISSSQHLTRYSYLGYSGVLKYANFALSLAYIDSALPRESSQKVHFYSIDRKHEIDNIKTAGIAYNDKALKLDYSYGVAKDYIKRHVIEFAYKPMDKLTFGSQIYGSTALKNHDKMKANVRDFDDSAWHYAADVEWKEADWSAKFGIAYTDANRKGAIGFYGRHLGKNNRGRYNGMAAAGGDYMRDGEIVLSSVVAYDFFKDNTTGLYLNYGEFNYKHETLKNGEINVFNIWKPTSGTFKNLSILSKLGYGWSYKTMSNKDITPKLRDGHAQRSPSLSAETVIDYRFNLL
ncbi:OprD family outer membrane porin [Gilliamella apis]|uniref:OprD family outer membrane porin n=1 Tax=Gilliamella apis TaxID=1970738 RepID=UPI000D788179|nr:OprD family outer membrane porin [Gilliamella apis]PXY93213.1 porin [Gilliamella apis]WLS97286.1 OprD family outer membrane porin [Gilliamella apis]